MYISTIKRIFQQRMRTNTDIEEWHARFIVNAGPANLTFYLLEPLLCNEANLACVQGSTNGTNGIPVSFKVLPMVPLVKPLVPMVMPMAQMVSQWYHC